MPTTVSASPVLVLWRLSTRISMRAQYPLWYYLMLIGLDAILIVGVLGRWQKRAAKLRSKLHGDLRQQMKKQRAGRETRLSWLNWLSTEGDYSEAELPKPINSQKWVRFCARARARKRGGESELHAALIKAASKKVFMQSGPTDKSRRVAYTGHVVEGLR